MARQIFQEWRDANDQNKYPFVENASMSNGAQMFLEGTFIDAIFYPVGGQAQLRLSQVIVAHDQVTLFIGDGVNPLLASCAYPVAAAPEAVYFLDIYGRPAGALLANAILLGLVAAWGTGTFIFDASATEFCSTVYVPVPAVGVAGVVLDDGTLLTGDLWLMGGDGITLTRIDSAGTEVIRVDVVGDPLFVRRTVQESGSFPTPNFIRSITFDDGRQSVVCAPDAAGNIQFTVNNALAEDTALRIYPSPGGNTIEVVGSVTQEGL